MSELRFARRGGAAILSFADSLEHDDAGAVAPPPVEVRTWLVFALAGELLAIDVAAVQEITRVPAITRVPESPPFVRGIFNHRGRVVAAVDLRLRLWFSREEPTETSRLLIVTLAGRTFGLLVDEVREIARIPAGATEPIPHDAQAAARNHYLLGLIRRPDSMILLLDAEKALLSSPDSD